MKKNKLDKSWITNPRGQDDTYKKEKKLRKEGAGNGGGGVGTSGSFGDSGGTVFTSSNAGIFTPTYGDNKRKPKKKKKSGIGRLADFITDNSPERKMAKSESNKFVVDLLQWVTKELRKDDVKFRQQTSSTEMNDQVQDPVEFDADPDEQADVEQKDMENKIRALDDKEDIKHNDKQEQGDANQAAPAGLEIQLAKGWEAFAPQDDLHRGGDKDKEQGEMDEDEFPQGLGTVDEEEEEIESPFKKFIGKDLYDKLVD
tara:strand:+ start:22354 stop:23124 length:771 start_codon:yes stop_codon:yes gene_type:complete